MTVRVIRIAFTGFHQPVQRDLGISIGLSQQDHCVPVFHGIGTSKDRHPDRSPGVLRDGLPGHCVDAQAQVPVPPFHHCVVVSAVSEDYLKLLFLLSVKDLAQDQKLLSIVCHHRAAGLQLCLTGLFPAGDRRDGDNTFARLFGNGFQRVEHLPVAVFFRILLPGLFLRKRLLIPGNLHFLLGAAKPALDPGPEGAKSHTGNKPKDQAKACHPPDIPLKLAAAGLVLDHFLHKSVILFFLRFLPA